METLRFNSLNSAQKINHSNTPMKHELMKTGNQDNNEILCVCVCVCEECACVWDRESARVSESVSGL
jgi:hypothetical protein